MYYIIQTNKITKVYRKNGRTTQYGEYDEDAQILGVSRGYAYKIIRGLNNELKEKGYRVISGKVPTKYFEEKFYGMAVG